MFPVFSVTDVPGCSRASKGTEDWHLSPLSMRATRPSTHSHQPSVPLDGRSRSQVSVSGVESECPGNESSLGVKKRWAGPSQNSVPPERAPLYHHDRSEE